MPIKINGTTVTTNRLNGTSITKETLNGTQVYGEVKLKRWYPIYESSSLPQTDLPYIHNSSDITWWYTTLIATYPPNNYPLGTTASIGNSNDLHYAYQIQEE